MPDGFAGVRVSQIWGARPGTLYPGVHLLTPLVDSVELYDTREQVYTTAAIRSAPLGGTPAATAASPAAASPEILTWSSCNICWSLSVSDFLAAPALYSFTIFIFPRNCGDCWGAAVT